MQSLIAICVTIRFSSSPRILRGITHSSDCTDAPPPESDKDECKDDGADDDAAAEEESGPEEEDDKGIEYDDDDDDDDDDEQADSTDGGNKPPPQAYERAGGRPQPHTSPSTVSAIVQLCEVTTERNR